MQNDDFFRDGTKILTRCQNSAIISIVTRCQNVGGAISLRFLCHIAGAKEAERYAPPAASDMLQLQSYIHL